MDENRNLYDTYIRIADEGNTSAVLASLDFLNWRWKICSALKVLIVVKSTRGQVENLTCC